jgi:hypothetical protein
MMRRLVLVLTRPRRFFSELPNHCACREESDPIRLSFL